MVVLKAKILVVFIVLSAQVHLTEEFNLDFDNEIDNFGLDLYRALAKKPGDVFFSPFSISSALAMCGLGAVGNTQEEIFKALNLTTLRGYDFVVWLYNQRYFEIYLKEGVTLEIANKPFVADSVVIGGNYKSLLTIYFETSLDRLDFKNSENASEHINNWIYQATENTTTELFKPTDFNDKTRLVFANAVYFKGVWKNKFDPEETKERDFYTDGSKVIKVPMMHKKSVNYYAEIEEINAAILELPYKVERFSMLILLPKEGVRLQDVEQKITAKTLASTKLFPTLLDVILPKFKIEASYKLEQELQALGIKKLFDRSAADLSGITQSERLSVSKMVHKSFVEVSEEGVFPVTTNLKIYVTNSSAPLEPVSFHADRPFIFFIRQNIDKVIYFIGSYSGH